MSRNTRDDVVAAAGRLFGERGYHGTSMRDLGRELGLFGSSIYSHVSGKQELLIEVVRRGAGFFQAAADDALAQGGTAAARLETLIEGHIDVILDHRDEVRTYLYESHGLDEETRERVIAARDRYEEAFRTVLKEGAADGSFREDLDPKVEAIFILSILNAVERWYRVGGPVGREALVDRISRFVMAGIGA